MSPMREVSVKGVQVRGGKPLGETGLSYFGHVFERCARPVALLDHLLPEGLGTKEVQTSTSDLELKCEQKRINDNFWPP